MKPNIVFFARAYQSQLFPLLTSLKYNSVFVTLTKSEKKEILQKGFEVKYCFEEYFKEVDLLEPSHYLETSFFSDRFLGRYKINDREKYLKREVAFWSDIFDEFRPVAVINEQVAIEISEVMYIEAKKRGIAYLAWMNNPINGYFYWLSNPMSLCLNKEIFETIPSDNSIVETKKYLFNVKVKNERPYYLNPFLNTTKIKRLLGSINSYRRLVLSDFLNIIKPKLQYEKYYEDAKVSVIRNFNSFFYKYDDINDLNEKEIICYPLHYEPESSLLYLSEFFSNQVSLIENLSKCLGQNQVLVVKEHPAQSGMLLIKRFRELHKRVSNLYYLPSTITSYEIISKSKIVVTLTSHLGWEAIILGKPVFVLGKMFYADYPFINKFESFELLRKRILENNLVWPQEDATLKFTAQLLDISYKGEPFPGNNLYSLENIQNLTKSIEEEINKITRN